MSSVGERETQLGSILIRENCRATGARVGQSILIRESILIIRESLLIRESILLFRM